MVDSKRGLEVPIVLILLVRKTNYNTIDIGSCDISNSSFLKSPSLAKSDLMEKLNSY